MKTLDKQTINLIKNMPKVILHVHLDGSLRPERVYERLQKDPLTEEKIENWYKNGDIFDSDKVVLIEIAKKGKNITLEEVKNYLSVDKDCTDLNQYLEKFALPCAVLQTKDDIEQSTYDLFEDLAKQNVKYAEIRFAPSKHCMNGELQLAMVDAAIRGMKKAKKDFNIDGNLILCCMRGRGEKNIKENLETLKTTKYFLNQGVCAADLAGAEALFKTKEFENYLLKNALNENIPLTIHAGEADGAESIKCALEYAKRIGHGVRCIENKELMEMIRKNDVVLEICPISNMQTQAVKGKHPLEELYKAGVKVTISTDNNTVSSTSINEELIWVLENTDLTINDLQSMQENAARGAFISLPEKTKLVAKVKGIENEKDFIK